MEAISEWPPHKYTLNELKKRELIKYGAEIPWDLLEKLINSGPRNEWNFKAQYIEFSQALKEEGFMLSETKMNGLGVRILDRQEMAEVVKRNEYKKANDSLRNSLMLSQVPRAGLSPHEQKKLDHWETKTAVVGATGKVLLRKRSLPPPDMVVKSVKQLAAAN